jgi:hypothetical protein
MEKHEVELTMADANREQPDAPDRSEWTLVHS